MYWWSQEVRIVFVFSLLTAFTNISDDRNSPGLLQIKVTFWFSLYYSYQNLFFWSTAIVILTISCYYLLQSRAAGVNISYMKTYSLDILQNILNELQNTMKVFELIWNQKRSKFLHKIPNSCCIAIQLYYKYICIAILCQSHILYIFRGSKKRAFHVQWVHVRITARMRLTLRVTHVKQLEFSGILANISKLKSSVWTL